MIHSVSVHPLVQNAFAVRDAVNMRHENGPSPAAEGIAADSETSRRQQPPVVGQAAENKSGGDKNDTSENGATRSENAAGDQKTDEAQAAGADSADKRELTEAQAREVEKLQLRDRTVRSHEQAHIAAGGAYVRSGARYEFERGPDGKNYAVGGEVSIDTSPVKGDPEATIRKMQTIRNAALAPADPSGTDRAVAAQAGRVAAEARAEQMAEQQQTVTDGASALSGDSRKASCPETERYIRIQSNLEKGTAVDIAV